ncbi:MAG TPA: TonB-dependent receptor plug domain-containing protein, partial [Bacteroidota bacterium]|nr:TonB-dependent receptor plug domain-containing protein [Bacteroidota bacterium]
MKFLKIFFILKLIPSILFSQVIDDSLKVYHLEEIVVTATRSKILLKDSPSSISIITQEQIQNTNGLTVADVLQNSQSVFLKDYGANGSLKTLSLRGTASEHQLVLVDGNRYSNFQNGLIDFSLIPLSNVERIEVVYGGNSALYGSDALGGVINILTRQPVSDRKVRSEVSKGSFGFERILLEGQGKFHDVGLLFGYLGEHGRDDYPYIVKQMNNFDTTLHRTNADFFRKQAYFNGVFQPDYHSSLTISSQYLTAERGAPGPFITLNDLSFARQSDDDINLLINYFDTHINGIEFSVGSGLHSALQRYVDPNPSFP